jgi:hypothetical protein
MSCGPPKYRRMVFKNHATKYCISHATYKDVQPTEMHISDVMEH